MAIQPLLDADPVEMSQFSGVEMSVICRLVGFEVDDMERPLSVLLKATESEAQVYERVGNFRGPGDPWSWYASQDPREITVV